MSANKPLGFVNSFSLSLVLIKSKLLCGNVVQVLRFEVHRDHLDKKKWLLVSHQFFLPSPGLYAAHRTNSTEYHFVRRLKTWSDARQYCRDKYTDLAAVRSQDESDEVHRLLQKMKARGAWIGLFDNILVWRWSLDGSVFNNQNSYEAWKSGQPSRMTESDSCVTVMGDGGWEDTKCDYKFPSVCYNGKTILFFLQTSKRQIFDEFTWFQYNTASAVIIIAINKKMKVSAFLFSPFQKQDPQSTFWSTTQWLSSGLSCTAGPCTAGWPASGTRLRRKSLLGW